MRQITIWPCYAWPCDHMTLQHNSWITIGFNLNNFVRNQSIKYQTPSIPINPFKSQNTLLIKSTQEAVCFYKLNFLIVSFPWRQRSISILIPFSNFSKLLRLTLFLTLRHSLYTYKIYRKPMSSDCNNSSRIYKKEN